MPMETPPRGGEVPEVGAFDPVTGIGKRKPV